MMKGESAVRRSNPLSRLKFLLLYEGGSPLRRQPKEATEHADVTDGRASMLTHARHLRPPSGRPLTLHNPLQSERMRADETAARKWRGRTWASVSAAQQALRGVRAKARHVTIEVTAKHKRLVR